MPIPDFDGNTFVAFTDISGFKEMMKHEEKAINALIRLNQLGYFNICNNNDVHGFFISDCGVLFVSNNELSNTEKLYSLLNVVEDLNRNLLNDDIMLTTSVAYGGFKYFQRIEIEGTVKHPIYGYAYVNAFLDNENGKPKIQPGQCRIIIKNLPDDLKLSSFSRLEKIHNSYYLFYWMVNKKQEIDHFKNEYNDSYSIKYKGMLSALKNARNDLNV